MLEFWIYLWFWIFQGSENARVTLDSEYFWICLNYSWICLIMLEYAWICLNIPEYTEICVNMPKSAGMVFFYISVSNLLLSLRDEGANSTGQESWFTLTLCSWFRIIITKQQVVLLVLIQYSPQKFSQRNTITGYCCFQTTKLDFAQNTFFKKN